MFKFFNLFSKKTNPKIEKKIIKKEDVDWEKLGIKYRIRDIIKSDGSQEFFPEVFIDEWIEINFTFFPVDFDFYRSSRIVDVLKSNNTGMKTDLESAKKIIDICKLYLTSIYKQKNIIEEILNTNYTEL